ncbi:MAG: ACT domain-containing protein, partial [Thermoguttaceae bacterium]|nr:ACT domain-containing protein [Thermoguttaceae bacterium]
VSPTLIPESAPLAKVRDAFNAVEIIGDFVGPVFYQGLGAGERPTASAVCSDVIDTAVGRTALTFNAVRMWAADRPALPLLPSSEIVGGAYLRMTVRDQPGVVAEIAGILGRHNISIASMLQAEAAEQSDSACLIILTHPAPEGALGTAVEELDCLEFNLAKTVRLAVGAPDTAV